ncbi:hypothetical protein EVAR_100723_1 [Eumeta japonica]|uniref:Uncharacterized protein n=1 Tax=Eumeta variegata TaxID=151549 RepID=A0A4C2A071_EUMVA|nr:hypothetical protein EVAR_100723_1 [Eumeta japonica]
MPPANELALGVAISNGLDNTIGRPRARGRRHRDATRSDLAIADSISFETKQYSCITLLKSKRPGADTAATGRRPPHNGPIATPGVTGCRRLQRA